ncbi:SusD family protein [bacterium A37T11]|nr:SusD family protein [bacterium A37T11]
MKRYILGLSLCICLASCNKYLEAVPDRSLAILTTVEQYEQLLNFQFLYTTAPAIPDFGSDDYYLSEQTWLASSIRIKNAYSWQSDFYEGNNSSGNTQDWNAPYNNIYYANVVLDGLETLKEGKGTVKYNEVKGHALFLRAFQHYQLEEVFGQPYRPETAITELGIPLKLSSDLTERVSRATVATVFKQIIQDLEKAAELLPADYQVLNKERASKAAVYALLSRIYLTMQDYGKSLAAADECLKRYNTLLNYADLAPAYKFSFPDNDEVLFVTRQGGTAGFFTKTNTWVDTLLFLSYDEADLRKQVFFKDAIPNGKSIKSMYSGTSGPFSGLALDEVYLNRAECRARLSDKVAALADLNMLLQHRFEPGFFTPLTEETATDILRKILQERRKELLIRGTRWTDLRRLNQDPAFAVTLRRLINGQDYTLPPNSPKYTYPIPSKEVTFNNLYQNER